MTRTVCVGTTKAVVFFPVSLNMVFPCSRACGSDGDSQELVSLVFRGERVFFPLKDIPASCFGGAVPCASFGSIVIRAYTQPTSRSIAIGVLHRKCADDVRGPNVPDSA